MALHKHKTPTSKKIAKLIKEGKPVKQAVAIAKSLERKKKRKKKTA